MLVKGKNISNIYTPLRLDILTFCWAIIIFLSYFYQARLLFHLLSSGKRAVKADHYSLVTSPRFLKNPPFSSNFMVFCKETIN